MTTIATKKPASKKAPANVSTQVRKAAKPAKRVAAPALPVPPSHKAEAEAPVRKPHNKPHVRMAPADRKALLDAQLLKTLKAEGINGLTRTGIALAADVTAGLIHRYYGNVHGMRKHALELLGATGKPADLKLVKKAIADGYDAKLLSRKLQQAIK